MPYRNPKKHRDYYREYMRRRRAEQRAPQVKPGATLADAELVVEIARLKDEIARLKAELASERGHRKMLEERLKLAQRQQRAGAPKAAKPSLPPDEVRERKIKALTTQVQNLRTVIQAIVGRASMPRATLNAIAKALHPDRKLSEAEREAERETALKLFTSWKADKD